ncbi:MAG: adenylyl-sulfate reductase subunit alpha [Thermoproteaceae archaeon]|nr:adenylyl-sulfate reductase subunit alpha [Thermoproteaceae archaeon]
MSVNPFNPPVRVVETDILVVGGGMAGCGAVFEAKYWCRGKCRVTLVEKANLEKSGAVGMGLSATNLGEFTEDPEDPKPEEFVKYVRNEYFGIVREDLVYDIARHMTSTIKLLDMWGLPLWRDPKTGKFLRSGRWQHTIHGESYKAIVAEPCRKSADEVYERVVAVFPLLDEAVPNRIAGVVGFHVRDGTMYVFKAKAVIVTAGGGSLIYRPRATSEGIGRVWYPTWASASAYGLTLLAGAEAVEMCSRLVVVRFKDGYGPVGYPYLLFKMRSTDVYGKTWEPLPDEARAEYRKLYGKYADARPTPTLLRVLTTIRNWKEGRGPDIMQTQEKLKTEEDIHILFEDYLDMSPTQAILWAAQNIHPEKRPSELMATEPYVQGSHATPGGMWASGPPDIAPPEYKWGPNRMLTVEGLFGAGDTVGVSGHKFSSGSIAEGRIAGKSAVRYVLTKAKDYRPTVSKDTIERYREMLYRPMAWYELNRPLTTTPEVPKQMTNWFEIHPNYLNWFQLLNRLMKTMDEYAAGWSAGYVTNMYLLNRAWELLKMLEEDFNCCAGAASLHELLRVWEFYHRLITAQAVVFSMMNRKETRYPGYYINADYPQLDEKNWHVFLLVRRDPKTGEWSWRTVPVIHFVP